MKAAFALAVFAVCSIGFAGVQGLTPAESPEGLTAADWSSIRGAYEATCHAVQPTAQQAYLKASNTDADDRFGWSLAMSGDTVVVGAPEERSSAVGVGGDQSDNSVLGAGAAYVFVRRATGWIQQAYLKASNTGTNDEFGYSVAASGDTLVVGARREASNTTGVNGDEGDNSASNSGAAYVFVRSGTTWSQQAYLKASNAESGDLFGFSVAISGDTVVIAARNEDSNANGVNGNQNNNGATIAGAAYVFVRSGTSWSQEAYLKASSSDSLDVFGHSVAVSGETVVVGARFEDGGATGVNGDESDNSVSASGATYVFVRNGTSWSQEAYLKASNTGADDQFGYSVAVSGETVMVGAWQEASDATGVNGDQDDDSATFAGAAYVFVRNGTGWSQEAYLKASNTDADDNFGRSVAVSGHTAVVGAHQEDSSATGVDGDQDDNGTGSAGAAYVFIRSGTSWCQEAYLKASDTDPGDEFGYSAAVSGDTLLVGAIGEASSATGVNGDRTDNCARDSGAAYVFRLPPLGRAYCATSPNSVGPGMLISATGSTSLANEGVTLRADGGPHDKPGIFFFGPVQLGGVTLGEGLRCVGGTTRRIFPFALTGPANGNPPGTAIRTLDFSLPYGASIAAAPPSTNFQYWYRDPLGGSSGFNLSDALEIAFAP